MANEDAQCRQSCNTKHPCTASKAVKSIHFLCIQALYFCPFLRKNAGGLSFLLVSFSCVDQRATWISTCDFMQSFLQCSLNDAFLYRGIAHGMGTEVWGAAGLLDCLELAAAARHREELEKMDTVWVLWSRIWLLVQAGQEGLPPSLSSR